MKKLTRKIVALTLSLVMCISFSKENCKCKLDTCTVEIS